MSKRFRLGRQADPHHGGFGAPKQVLECLLNRGIGSDADTQYFRGVSHDVLLRSLADYFNNHRHFLQHCRIQICQGLNDNGVDLLLESHDWRVGLQVKSHFDVVDRNFSTNVKRQFAEALSYGLDRYYIMICAALGKEHGRDTRMAVAHVLNEVRTFKLIDFSAYGPEHTIRVLRTPQPTVSREDLLLRGAIAGDALYDFECGYEDLPPVSSDAITLAQERVDAFGDDFWDDEDGRKAFSALNAEIEAVQIRQFNELLLPQLPDDVRTRRTGLIATIHSLLGKCRACSSWGDRSEYKLPQWLSNVPESMIPYTSLPNLLRIERSMHAYLSVHMEMMGLKDRTSQG